ncbi:MAG TPA: hypothetical protein VFW71_15955 [Actinomycetota bacterium]|nr:hypothetical protein [Actinomycetota bacterium]
MRIRTIVIVVVLLLVVGEGASRVLIQSDLTARVKAADPTAIGVQTSVSFPLLPRLVLGQTIDSVKVTARTVALGVITADSVTVTANSVHLRLGSLVGSRVHVSRVEHLTIVATITDVEASSVLRPGLSFTFGVGTVTLHNPVTSVTGRFALQSPGTLSFMVVGSGVPGLSASLTFSKAPFATCTPAITLTPGHLTLSCTLANPPPGVLSLAGQAPRAP